jgi:hypothetical protein
MDPKALMAAFNNLFPPMAMEVDGVRRSWDGWDEWSITTEIDADAHWQTTRAAILCHRSQLATLPDYAAKLDEHHTELVGRQYFYRAFSLVNGGRSREKDMFEGLR